jgi:hypothetical protein
MISKKFIALFALAMACVLPTPANALETVVFSDDFQSADAPGTILPDAPPIGDPWRLYVANAVDSRIDNNPSSEARNNSTLSYFISRPDPVSPGTGVSTAIAPIAQVYRDLIADNGNAKISFKYYDTGATNGLSFIANNSVPGVVPTGNAATGLNFNNGVIFQTGSGATNVNYTVNDWHDVQLDLDFVAQSYTLTLNGVLAPSVYPFLNSGRPTISNLWFGNYGRPSAFYIDDVRVSTVGVDPPALREWQSTGAGVWSNVNNWDPAFVPDGPDHQVLFGASITAPSTVALDTAVTVNTIEFNNANSYAVGGPGSIALSGASPSILSTTGNHQLQVKVSLEDFATAAGTGGSLDFNNVVDLGGNQLTTTGAVNLNHSVISSTGTGSIVNSGVLGTAGGTPIAANLTSTGSLAIDIAGVAANQVDVFSITGSASLQGSILVDVLGSYSPAGPITILTATGGINLTGALTLSGPDANLFSGVSVVGNNLVLNVGAAGPTGDYNGNGVVDAADYTVWRDTLNTNVAAGTGADGNQNGMIDTGDYTFWKTRFGNNVGSGAGLSAAVPEPATAWILLIGLVAMLSQRGRN